MKVEQVAKGHVVEHPYATGVRVIVERKQQRGTGPYEVSGYYVDDPRTQVGFVVNTGTDLALR